MVLLALQAGTVAARAAGEGGREVAYYEYSLARQAWWRQDYSLAIGHLQRAIAADPGSSELFLELGRLRYDLNEHDEAAEAARRATALAPDSPAAHRLLADSLFALTLHENAQRDLIEQSIDSYGEAIRLDPQDGGAYLNMGKLLLSRGSLQEALAAFERHMELEPGSEEGAYLAAHVLTKMERHVEATRLLEAAVARRPDSVQLRVALLESHEAAGNLDQAVAVATQLLHLGVSQLRVRFALVRLNQRLGRTDEAIRHLREVNRIMDLRSEEFSEGDRAEVSHRMVRALLGSGKYEEALEHAEEGVKRFPDDPRFLLRKGEALLMQGQWRQADEVFDGVIAATDDDQQVIAQISDAYLSAGANVERGGDAVGAEKHLRKAVELNPSNAQALNYLGYILIEKDTDLEEALALIRRALERDPGNGAYLDSLGWAYYKLGDFKSAEKALAEALTALPDEPVIHAHLGDLYAATGRTQEAILAWQEALDRGVENADEIRAKVEAARSGRGDGN